MLLDALEFVVWDGMSLRWLYSVVLMLMLMLMLVLRLLEKKRKRCLIGYDEVVVSSCLYLMSRLAARMARWKGRCDATRRA